MSNQERFELVVDQRIDIPTNEIIEMSIDDRIWYEVEENATS